MFGFLDGHFFDRDHADSVANVWAINRELAVFLAAVVEEAGGSGVGVGVLHGSLAIRAGSDLGG